MLTNPDVVLFAIQSGIRLGKQIQRAYVDNLKSRGLVLPLPDFPARADWTSALNYFEGTGSVHVEDNPRIATLLDKAQQGTLTPEEKEEFSSLHQQGKAIDNAERGDYLGSGITAEDMRALFRVRQWREGEDPNPTALKRIAGTVIEIAVDYFANMPGALNGNSAHSIALKGFLIAIDDVNFVDTPVEEISAELLVAAIETISETPELLTADEKAQELIESVTKGIASDVKDRIEEIRSDEIGDLEAEERIRGWGELIFRSVLSNASETVLSNPTKFLGTAEGAESAMVTSVGRALMDVILTDSTEVIRLEALFSRDAVDKIVKAALNTLGDHPELLGTSNEGLRNILSQVAKDLAASSRVLDPDILPEMMRLVLEKTSRNLDILWPTGDGPEPVQHLLVTACKEVLETLAQATEDNVWRVRLTKGQIVEVLETVLDEVIENPDWILKEAQQLSPLLRDALEGALEALSQRPLGTELGIQILRSVIKAVALRREFVEIVPIGDGDQKKRLVSLALDAIFDAILGGDASTNASWVLARSEFLKSLVQEFLNKLAKEGVSQSKIAELKRVLSEEVQKLADGEPFSFESLIARIENADLGN